jgi:hypothetical protein
MNNKILLLALGVVLLGNLYHAPGSRALRPNDIEAQEQVIAEDIFEEQGETYADED